MQSFITQPEEVLALASQPRHSAHALPVPALGCVKGSPSRLLLTGCGRSGTHALAIALQKMGIAVEHEGWQKEPSGAAQLLSFAAHWLGVGKHNSTNQPPVLVSWPAAVYAASERQYEQAAPCYSPVIKFHRSPLATIFSLAKGFNADGNCRERNSGLFDAWSWWFAGHFVPLPEQWTNGSWEEAVAFSTRTQPPWCGLGHKARLRLALHYWVGWNALADAIADYSLPIEGVTAEKVHEVWCSLCESRGTGRSVAKHPPCACSVPKRRSGDLQGEQRDLAGSTKVTPRRHHNATTGSLVIAANLTWQELRWIDPIWSARAEEAARRYGYVVDDATSSSS